eukprot:scaffold7571_cov403-Prasinococcus_capsulatus_cf.AAC.1
MATAHPGHSSATARTAHLPRQQAFPLEPAQQATTPRGVVRCGAVRELGSGCSSLLPNSPQHALAAAAVERVGVQEGDAAAGEGAARRRGPLRHRATLHRRAARRAAALWRAEEAPARRLMRGGVVGTLVTVLSSSQRTSTRGCH